MHLEFKVSYGQAVKNNNFTVRNVRTRIESWCANRELDYELSEHRIGSWSMKFKLFFHSEQDLTLFVLGFGKYDFRVVK